MTQPVKFLANESPLPVSVTNHRASKVTDNMDNRIIHADNNIALAYSVKKS